MMLFLRTHPALFLLALSTAELSVFSSGASVSGVTAVSVTPTRNRQADLEADGVVSEEEPSSVLQETVELEADSVLQETDHRGAMSLKIGNARRGAAAASTSIEMEGDSRCGGTTPIPNCGNYDWVCDSFQKPGATKKTGWLHKSGTTCTYVRAICRWRVLGCGRG